MTRRVAIIALCDIYQGSKHVGFVKVVLQAPTPKLVFGEVERMLCEEPQLANLLRYWHLRKYCVTRLRCRRKNWKPDATEARRGSGGRQRPGPEHGPGPADPLAVRNVQSSVWPKGWRRVYVRATVRASAPVVPREMRVRLINVKTRLPAAHYLRRLHRVRCGCVTCVENRSDKASGQSPSEPPQQQGQQQQQQGQQQQPYTSRRRLYKPECGYWTPCGFVEHVVGCSLKGGRQPPGMPRLTSENYLELEVPPPVAGSSRRGKPTQLSIRAFKRQFGVPWLLVRDDPPDLATELTRLTTIPLPPWES
ncbi:hypothetical protein PLESTM_000944400 [Pleodorina starrii]|nr:hypothetical protein PLESTM_000944400 [Pleodorina starrii]